MYIWLVHNLVTERLAKPHGYVADVFFPPKSVCPKCRKVWHIWRNIHVSVPSANVSKRRSIVPFSAPQRHSTFAPSPSTARLCACLYACLYTYLQSGFAAAALFRPQHYSGRSTIPAAALFRACRPRAHGRLGASPAEPPCPNPCCRVMAYRRTTTR